MHIGILETGRPNPELIKTHGSYPDMLRRLLGDAGASFEYTVYPVVDSRLPAHATLHDGWLVTGSPHGVYEKLPWMLQAENLLREAVVRSVPIVGICFGHQLLAQALGGTVTKSEKGWGLGLQEYEVCATDPRFPMSNIILPASHQDQVVRVPAGAHVLARSAHCAHAILAYNNHALTFQAHPEFTTELVAASLAQKKQKGEISPELIAAAVSSLLHKQSHGAAVGRIIADFYLKR